MAQEKFSTPFILEHACKQDFKNVIQKILEDANLPTYIAQNVFNPEQTNRIKCIFLFIYILKRLNQDSNITKAASKFSLHMIVELLDTIYKQYNFISLKKYLTLVSEMKLLDLLHLIIHDSKSSDIIQKLNQQFPRWSLLYKKSIENNFPFASSKVLQNMERSHIECRKLILKLTFDKVYRLKYISDEYSNDIKRLEVDLQILLSEAINVLKLYANSSSLEMMKNGEICFVSDNAESHLLLDYMEPEITEEGMLQFLQDLDPISDLKSPPGLAACLMPFDTMSDDDCDLK